MAVGSVDFAGYGNKNNWNEFICDLFQKWDSNW